MIQHQILDTKMFPSISEANDINEAVAISKHFIYENSSDTEDDEIVDNNEGTVETTADYNKFDVLLGRGRAYQLYPGNRRFHVLINGNADRYAQTSAQSDKWKITMEIVEAVLAKGRFLKPSKAHGWTVVALDTARQKVAHALQYQKRRHTKNALKQPQKVTLTFLPMSTIVNNDDQEGTMASYPNVNRTYFSEQPAGFNVSTNETFLSATEKYLHGMVAAEPAVTSIQAIFRHNQDSASFKSTPQHLPLGSIMPRHYIEPETPLLTTLLSLCAEQSVVGSVNKSVSPTAPILARVDDIQVWDDEWDLSDGDFLAGVGFVSSGTDGFKPISLANIDFEPFDIDTEPIKFDSSETNAIQRPVQVPQGKRNYCTKDISALAASKKLLSDTKSTVDDTTSFRFFPIDCELAKSSAVCDDLPSLDLFDILEMEHQREMTLVDQSREWEKCTENDESLSSSFYIDATEPLAFEGALSAW